MARQRLFFSLLTSVNAHTRPFEITTSRAPVCVCVCLRARACVEFQSLLHLTDFHEIQYQRNVTVDHQNVTGFNSLQQFLTNHGCFRSYLHKRNKAPSASDGLFTTPFDWLSWSFPFQTFSSINHILYTPIKCSYSTHYTHYWGPR